MILLPAKIREVCAKGHEFHCFACSQRAIVGRTIHVMITYLLDTSVYSQRLRRHPHPETVRRWSALGNSRCAVSTICEAEVLFGLEKKASPRLWTEYEQYLKNQLVLLPLDRKVIEAYARIKAETLAAGFVVGEFDLLIGATAIANGLKLATLNVKDFSKIAGLDVEDWS